VHERTCRDVLKRLTDAGWLYRLPRRLGEAYGGGGQFTYALGIAGQRFLGYNEPRRPRITREHPLDHALANTEIFVRLEEARRIGLLATVGYLPEFEGLPHVQPDALVGLLLPSRDLDETKRFFLEIELTRKGSRRLDEKLSNYVDAWRRFPRVLYLADTSSRFPSDAALIRREIEAAIRRQPADARHLFALAMYEEALPILLGTAEVPVIAMPANPVNVRTSWIHCNSSSRMTPAMDPLRIRSTSPAT
jgi:hypothetical protein